MNRPAVYLILNFAFAASAVVGSSLHGVGVHPLYLVPLFAICSSAIIDAKKWNGPQSLLVLWSAFYFLLYGALDYQYALLGREGIAPESDAAITAAEMIILLGAAMVHVMYRIASKLLEPKSQGEAPKDWSEMSLVFGGLLLWLVSSRLSWEYSVNIMYGKSVAEVQAAFRNMGGPMTMVYMLARMAQPVSILILAYAQSRYQRAYMLPVIVGIVAYQLFYGFVVDTKGEALIGGILVIIVKFLVNGRIPKAWLVSVFVVTLLTFPIMQANRIVRGERSQDTHQVSNNIGEALQRAISGTDKANKGKERAQTALERSTLKGSVQTIVTGAGSVAPYQNGHTLSPILFTFVPRLLWSDKPSIPAGQLLNKEFHLGGADTTYFSPSHIGDLYWNFGWLGVAGGMGLIGLILGTLGRRCDLSQATTLTRVLILMVTVKQVILGAEGEFAIQYVVWLRALLGIAILHGLFARRPVEALANSADEAPQGEAGSASRVPFPNLLR